MPISPFLTSDLRSNCRGQSVKNIQFPLDLSTCLVRSVVVDLSRHLVRSWKMDLSPSLVRSFRMDLSSFVVRSVGMDLSCLLVRSSSLDLSFKLVRSYVLDSLFWIGSLITGGSLVSSSHGPWFAPDTLDILLSNISPLLDLS